MYKRTYDRGLFKEFITVLAVTTLLVFSVTALSMAVTHYI